MSKSIMKAKSITLSILDASLVFSIWGTGKLDRSNVRAAVEINDTFEPILEGNRDLLGKAAKVGAGKTDAEREEAAAAQEDAVEALTTALAPLTLSQAAYDSIRAAVKGHDRWTCRGARQLLRIETAFAEAEEVDLEPKKVEE